MSAHNDEFTIGVEEEYLVLDPVTRDFRPDSLLLLDKARHTLGEQVQPEIQLSQIETATSICSTLADVRRELIHLRQGLFTAASQVGVHIAAAGTHPFADWKDQQTTPKERYQALLRDYQQLTREQGIQGCHIHVGLQDREIGVQVMNRVRPWLAVLLALAANSPFWLGEETGYASYRTEIWTRWPTAGPPQAFDSLAQYRAVVQSLIATRSVDDATKIYWDVRLSERFNTIEFRVTDVCMTIDEAVMLAGLTRALVRTCLQEVIQQVPSPTVRPELLRTSHWRAARYGLEDELIDTRAEQAIPAHELVERLLSFVRPALEAEGDWSVVSSQVEQVLQHGNGATRQRQVYQRTGRLEDVVDFIVAETAKGVTQN
jgi:glutamate---cysteine ligase / carboxylate-amine ligase